MKTEEVAMPSGPEIARLARVSNDVRTERKPPKRLKLERVKSQPGGGTFGGKGSPKKSRRKRRG